MNFIQTENINLISQYRSELYNQFTGTLDGMWQDLYIASATPFLIEIDSNTVGYCCIDDNKSLLQLFLKDEAKYLMEAVISTLITKELITFASLSSIDPISFNTALSLSKSNKINTFCFQYAGSPLIKNSAFEITNATVKDADTMRAFLKNNAGFDDTFGYTDNLINRKELYIAKEGDNIIASGECRISDTQKDVADLGVIVNTEYRKKGLGAKMLNALAQKAVELNKQPVCSTTYDNIASKKAIEKAGFYNSFIIFDMSFIS
ncbi:GNAT family N-acetyltransferase [Flammeovirga kamogawensis]|uniref:GNAT family N-acetyltransferase n=1 Tax=Flammeovirga kamogawensis TaxID=373891 RepID=A0ABX8GZ49_9BACT|nr:GNAT family N-acetyltransferase [Flammeovirga kamogawensis]MBB6459330.1 putative GNAT family acetyltransferase [Flammeovirga kamogawensis]QWG08889.1 GNAT family N-acetyltransferase [Flammeovirga kamogawensis]TRX67179.1 GNAT family N-acetyltransferase [Flammeovirga kamogawensis]